MPNAMRPTLRQNMRRARRSRASSAASSSRDAASVSGDVGGPVRPPAVGNVGNGNEGNAEVAGFSRGAAGASPSPGLRTGGNIIVGESAGSVSRGFGCERFSCVQVDAFCGAAGEAEGGGNFSSSGKRLLAAGGAGICVAVAYEGGTFAALIGGGLGT